VLLAGKKNKQQREVREVQLNLFVLFVLFGGDTIIKSQAIFKET